MGIDINLLSPAAQKQIAEQLIATKQSKYHNKRVTRYIPHSGKTIKFDSKREAERFDVLYELYKVGIIRDLRLQEEFTLIEAYTDIDGNRNMALKYRADFSYEIVSKYKSDGTIAAWERVVEDVKGVRTEAYKIKRKLMREKYRIEIKEV